MKIDRQHFPLLLAISASLFCTPLMMAGVNAVLPEIGNTLDATATQLAMVGTMYSLGLAIFQLAAGSLGDIKGHRRLFLYGALLFAASGTCLGFVRTTWLFLLLRFIQGSAGALMSASGLALVACAAPPEKRTTYFGITGAAVYAGIACGPPLASLVTSYAGWPFLFWINSLTTLLVYLLMKHTVSLEWCPSGLQPFDFVGFLLYAIAMAALSLSSGGIYKDIYVNLALFLVFPIFLLLFILHEKKCIFPVLNLKLMLERPIFTFSALAALINYASFFGLVFYFSFYLQIGKNASLRETGMILAIQPLAQTFATPFATRLCHCLSNGIACAIGTVCCGIGLLVAGSISLSTSILVLIIAQIILGCGISIFSLANTTMIMETAGKENTGQASAVTGAVRTAGQLWSMTFITFSLAWFLDNAVLDKTVLPEFMQSMRASLTLFAILNLLSIFLVVYRNRRAAQAIKK